MFVIPDLFDSNRYFVGFQFRSGTLEYTISGMIIYFDSNGIASKCDKDYTKTSEINILDKAVCTYDTRNGIIDENNSYLYNQTLMFTQVGRDTNTLSIRITRLSWTDKILEQSDWFDTQIKTSTNLSKNKNLHTIYNPRFCYIIMYNPAKLYGMIDLGSLKLVKNHVIKHSNNNYFHHPTSTSTPTPTQTIGLDYLTINYYLVNNLDNLDNYNEFEKIFDKQEKYSDEYPELCPRCNKLTTQATYYYPNSEPYCQSFMELGKAFCSDCLIRYSWTEKSWVCCNLTHDNTGNLCSNILDSNKNNYLCELYHSTTNTPKTKLCFGPDIKYPYKKNIYVYSESI